MTSDAHLRPPTDPAARRPRLAVLASVSAASAWFGAVGLSLGWIGLGARLNRRLPFDSPVLGGIALATVVAVPLTALAWCAWRGDRRVGLVAVISGGLLLGWIAVQIALLRELSPFQPLYALVGLVLVVAGRRASTITHSSP